MKIGLDVMGGDFAPKSTVSGAILAQKSLPDNAKIVLFGNKSIIEEEFRAQNGDLSLFEIFHCSEEILMGESPTKGIAQKTDSSIVKGFECLKNGSIQGFCSAGNTGAMLVGAMFSIKNIPGISRPCTTTVLPKEDGSMGILLDVGTNPDVKPELLREFAIVGNVYVKNILGIPNPRIGLLNIGEEEEKGNLLTKDTFKLLKEEETFNFIGNIEPRDLFKNKADVIVCDGFTGNIVLKQTETMFRLMLKRGWTDEFTSRLNYEQYGGTPILGVNGTAIIGHGISNDIAIKNMIIHTHDVHVAGISEKINKAINNE